MKIDFSANYRQLRSSSEIGTAASRAQSMTAGSPREGTAAKTVETAVVAGGRRPDFTNMTRAEMRDWVNERIRSGQMSLDDGAPLMLMTMKISVGAVAEVPVADDHERIDFIARAQQGIEGALWRNDREAARQLRATLDAMQRNQQQASGLSIRA